MAKWQRLKIELPEGLTPAEREAIGQRVIETIKERTANGVGISGGRRFKFPGYSEAYINSPAFKKAGKSPNKVNLKLSGEMLDELQLLANRPRELLIGFEKGTFANDKADGNSEKRPFLGLTKAELEEILADYSAEAE